MPESPAEAPKDKKSQPNSAVKACFYGIVAGIGYMFGSFLCDVGNWHKLLSEGTLAGAFIWMLVITAGSALMPDMWLKDKKGRIPLQLGLLLTASILSSLAKEPLASFFQHLFPSG
jgi:hypothetical protein